MLLNCHLTVNLILRPLQIQLKPLEPAANVQKIIIFRGAYVLCEDDGVTLSSNFAVKRDKKNLAVNI